MIRQINPAFEFLRKHKQVTDETEALVMKRVKGRLSSSELFSVFENGITGQYGKVYSLDAQTLVGWVAEFLRGKESPKNYLSSGLLPVDYPTWEVVDWDKEANKCFTAFLNGVSEANFNPGVYDRMMVDGKIKLNAYMEFFTDSGDTAKQVIAAKQRVLRNVFLTYKSNGWTTVYFING